MDVEIVEVSPRDGLQNEAAVLSTADKIALIEKALAAGLRGLEGISRIGLVLNRRGLDRALRAGVDEVNYVVSASETFSQRNQGASVADVMQGWTEVAAIARHENKVVSVVVTTAFGCPFEGEIAAARVGELVGELVASEPDEIALADTIGVASPLDVTERFALAAEAAPGVRLRAHFHNTRNTGFANAYAALQSGVTVLDSSIGGIGGCPFAPAATGNIATEDLAYMLRRMGHVGGVDLRALIAAAAWLQERVGHPVPAMLGRAGVFPG